MKTKHRTIFLFNIVALSAFGIASLPAAEPTTNRAPHYEHRGEMPPEVLKEIRELGLPEPLTAAEYEDSEADSALTKTSGGSVQPMVKAAFSNAPLSSIVSYYTNLTKQAATIDAGVNEVFTFKMPKLMTAPEAASYLRDVLAGKRIAISDVGENTIRVNWRNPSQP